MFALLCFVLAVLASPFKSKSEGSWNSLHQYPAGVTNSDNGDDSSGDDCNSDDGGDNGNGGGGNNMPKQASARPRRATSLALL
jgi:hypothetical protein